MGQILLENVNFLEEVGQLGGNGLITGLFADHSLFRIQTWALEEARRRLEIEGVLPDPDNEVKN